MIRQTMIFPLGFCFFSFNNVVKMGTNHSWWSLPLTFFCLFCSEHSLIHHYYYNNKPNCYYYYNLNNTKQYLNANNRDDYFIIWTKWNMVKNNKLKKNLFETNKTGCSSGFLMMKFDHNIHTWMEHRNFHFFFFIWWWTMEKTNYKFFSSQSSLYCRCCWKSTI